MLKVLIVALGIVSTFTFEVWQRTDELRKEIAALQLKDARQDDVRSAEWVAEVLARYPEKDLARDLCMEGNPPRPITNPLDREYMLYSFVRQKID